MRHQVFLSYSTRDAAFAGQLYDYLTGRGLACWMAPRSIAPGSEYGEAIIAGIEQAKVFVLIYSEHSNQSQHVLREVERCVNKKTPLIVYKIAEVQPTQSMEYFLMANQWMQAADAPEKHMEELYEAVSGILKRTENSTENVPPNAGRTEESEVYAEGSKASAGRRSKTFRLAAMACFLVAAVAVITLFMSKNGKNDGAEGAQGGGKTEASSGTPSQSLPEGDVDAADAQKQEDTLSVKVGEYVTFGRYYPQEQENAGDADINWLVLSVDEQAGTVLLISEKLIDMKPYDVAESGIYKSTADGVTYDRTKPEDYSNEELAEFFGNSDWEKSNIRAWLNSADSAVSYDGQEPVSKGTDDGVNGYQNQAGFLYDFTQAELERIVVTAVETPANALGEGTIVTNDRVFLLSAEEAETYLDGQKLSRYAAPTDAAIAASRGTIYPLYHSYNQETIPWYFRTPDTDSAHKVMLCGSGFEGEADVHSEYACSAGYGIRPVIVVKVNDSELSGDGTRLSPYTVK